MAGVNKVILAGYVAHEPKFERLNDGVIIVSFGLTTVEHIEVSGGTREQTETHNVVMRGSLGIAASKALARGKFVSVEGKVRSRRFQNETGHARHITEIIGDNFTVLRGDIAPTNTKYS